MSDLPEIRARAARRLISWRFCHSLHGMGVLKSLRALISRQGLLAVVLVAYPALTHAAVTTGLGYLASAAWLCLAALLYLSFPGQWGFAGVALVGAAPLVDEPGPHLQPPPLLFNLAPGAWFVKAPVRGEAPVISWLAR